MRARPLVAAAIALAVGAAPAVQALSRPAAGPAGRYLVRLADGQEAARLAPRLRALGVTSAVAFSTVDTIAMTATRRAVDSLLASGVATSARPERKIKLHLASSVPYIGADRATIGATRTIKVKGAAPVVRKGVDGTGTTVAVLDTGIMDMHPDLFEKVVAHRNFELSYVADLLLTTEQLDTWAELTGITARPDDIGHGTHVAGIVAGTGFAAQHRVNNNRGVAPGAKLIDLRIAAGPIQGFVGDTGWERNAIAAFDWLARHHKDAVFGPNGIRLSTNSWGLLPEDLAFGAPSYDPLRQIIEVLDNKGVITVFSAGNDGPGDNVTNATVPNGLPEVISVAASCNPSAIQEACDVEGNDIGAFSSRGPGVDIAAPGVEIVSTVSLNAVGALGKACLPAELFADVPCTMYRGSYGGPDATEADVMANYALYGSLHGTSMAAPHIAGVVALLLQANPRLTPQQVQVVLAGSASDRQKKGRDIEAGWGLVNVPNALTAATRFGRGESAAKIFPALRWKP